MQKVSQSVPDKIDRKAEEGDSDARRHNHEGIRTEIGTGIADHDAPVRSGRRYAESEI